jgi:ATP-binding cassette, subfamily B, bacterial
MIKRLRRIGELLWESGPIACIGLFALTLFSGVLPAAQLWVGKLIIDTVVQAATRIDGEALTGRAFSLVGLELALFATSAAIQTGNSLLSEIYGEKLTFQINGRILRKADELDLTYFEDPKFYDSLQRAQREAGYRPLSLLGQFLGITQSLIGSISLIVLLVRLGWFVVPILLVALYLDGEIRSYRLFTRSSSHPRSSPNELYQISDGDGSSGKRSEAVWPRSPPY